MHTTIPQIYSLISYEEESSPESVPNQMPIRIFDRLRKQPQYLKDFHCNTLLYNSTNSSIVLYPHSHVLSYHHISPKHFQFLSTISVHDEPTNYKQVVQHIHWIQAMNSELDALNQKQYMDCY